MSYRKDPSETTEWDDIQRKLGNLPPLPEKAAPPPVDDAEIDDESALRVVLDSHTVEELAEVDDDEFADDRFFEEYRAKRIAELRGKEAAERFGEVCLLVHAAVRSVCDRCVWCVQVYPLTKPEFLKEVTEASKDGTWILILLFQAGLVESRVVEEAFTQLARLHRTVKFMKIIATQCIENYPDRCACTCACTLV